MQRHRDRGAAVTHQRRPWVVKALAFVLAIVLMLDLGIFLPEARVSLLWFFDVALSIWIPYWIGSCAWSGRRDDWLMAGAIYPAVLPFTYGYGMEEGLIGRGLIVATLVSILLLISPWMVRWAWPNVSDGDVARAVDGPDSGSTGNEGKSPARRPGADRPHLWMAAVGFTVAVVAAALMVTLTGVAVPKGFLVLGGFGIICATFTSKWGSAILERPYHVGASAVVGAGIGWVAAAGALLLLT